METYTIVKKKPGMTWDNVPVAYLDKHTHEEVPEIKTQAQVMWDEEGFYVHMEAIEPNIRKEESGVMGKTWEDSCMEFFVAPIPGDNRYFNHEVSAGGVLYWGFGSEINSLVRMVPEKGHFIKPEVELGEGHWSVTYFVPAYGIRFFFPEFEMKAGAHMRGNFYKCGDETVKPHFQMWSQAKDSYHDPSIFGEFILGE